MNILAFDTCFAACSAAAARGFDPDAPHDACLTGRFEPMATGHAERLPLMIAETMTAAGLAFSQLDRLAVTNGPGSFTGTRIAVAAARALALASSLEVVVVSSLAVMASQAAEHLSTHIENARKSAPEAAPLLIAVDARRGEVYVQQFKSGGADAVTGPLLLPVADAAALGGTGPLVVAGSGAGAVAQAAAEAGRVATAHLADLLPDARDLCRLAATMEPACGDAKPLYLRPADAKPQTGRFIERATT